MKKHEFGAVAMKITIKGDPVAKKRPKFSYRGGRAIAYDDQKKIGLACKAKVLSEIKRNGFSTDELEVLKTSPVKISLKFMMPIPASDTQETKNLKLWGYLKPTTKPDLDNLVKFYLDVCNEIIYADDSQIIDLHAVAKYSNNPCTIIEIHDIHLGMDEKVKKLLKNFSPDELTDLGYLIERLYYEFAKNYTLPQDDPYGENGLFQKFVENPDFSKICLTMDEIATKYSSKLKKLVNK